MIARIKEYFTYEKRLRRAIRSALGRGYRVDQNLVCEYEYLIYRKKWTRYTLIASVYAPRLSDSTTVTFYGGEDRFVERTLKIILEGIVMQERAKEKLAWATS